MPKEKKEDKIVERLKDQPPFIKADDPADDSVEEVEEEKAEPKVEGEETKAEVKTTEEKEEKEEKEDKKDRTTKQFEKLTKSNKELKKENEKIKEEARKMATEGAVSSLTPEPEEQPKYNWDQMLVNQPPPAGLYPNLGQKQVKDVFEGLIDDQGYVNTDLLKETLEKANHEVSEAKKEAERAHQEVKANKKSMDDFQRTQIAREVHGEYPELDPDNEDFNPDFFEAVRDKMIANLAKGQPEDFMGAAKSLFKRYTMKKEEKKAVEDQQNAIAQINATKTGDTSSRRKFGEHEELVEAVRANKKGALAERLKRSGY